MKDILFIADDDYIGGSVEGIIYCMSEYEAMARISEDKDSVLAVIEDILCAESSGFFFSGNFMKNEDYGSIPVLGISRDVLPIDTYRLVSCNFSDIIFPPFYDGILQQRVRDAVYIRESFTFSEIEDVLHELPSNIYLKDSKGRYIFSTHYWHHIEGADQKDFSIRGKTDMDIRKDKDNARKAQESDREVMTTGKSTSYVIEENSDGIREFLEVIKCPTHDKFGNINGIVGLVNDVTENQLLKLELERRSKMDTLTGLLNKKSTEDLIELSIMKDRREGVVSSGALFMIDVDNFKFINDTYGHIMGDRVLMTVGSIIHNHFGGHDITGRVGGDEFMVFSQDMADEALACKIAGSLESEVRKAFMDDLNGRVSLSIGIAISPEHGKSFTDLYGSADKALYCAKNAGKGRYEMFHAA